MTLHTAHWSFARPPGLLVAVVFALAAGAGLSPAAEPPKLALLVGCNKYQGDGAPRELYGPANDVPKWADLLTDPKGFAFPNENVTRLVGWPDQPEKRPTYANIVKGFENLIAQAQPGSQVVILMSGHGMQVPIPDTQKDPLDPKNPEPDGLDEVFLPADVKLWGEKGLENAILDDQIGAWLDRLRDKDAHVLIVFDSCHSGTMTRGPKKGEPDPANPEVSRLADPATLGVTREMLEKAAARGAAAVAAAKKAGRPIPSEANVVEKPGRKGSLVAFYAAQSFEEAPELPLPEDEPVLRENYYGMLSFTVVKAIRQRQSGLSYDELLRLVTADYRAQRGTRGPTPFAEGDLNREVLGLTVWPNRPAIYAQLGKDGKLTVDAGALHGLTEGSILSLLKPGGQPKESLGYLKVGSVGPASAAVAPVEAPNGFNKVPLLDPAKLPKLARCEVVLKDFGDRRVKVLVDGKAAKEGVALLDKEVKDMVRVVVAEAEAEWVLRAVTPAQAAADYGQKGLVGDQVFLLQGTGRTRGPDAAKQADAPKSLFPKIFGKYPAGDARAVAGALGVDLPKVFTWQNVWRVASAVPAAEGGQTHGLKVEVVKLKDENDKVGEVLRDGVLRDKQDVVFRAQNEGPHNLWVSAFYLDANLEIRELFSGGVGRGKLVKLYESTMTTAKESTGVEGLVVFAVPQAAVNQKPNYGVIVQEPLTVADRGKGGAVNRGGSPFDQLLAGAAVNKGTRGSVPKVASTPAILSQSWVLLP